MNVVKISGAQGSGKSRVLNACAAQMGVELWSAENFLRHISDKAHPILRVPQGRPILVDEMASELLAKILPNLERLEAETSTQITLIYAAKV